MSRGALTAKQRRFLRALGHHLDPLVKIGKEGVTDGVCAELEQALLDHELVKIRVLESCPDGRGAVASRLARSCEASVAGEIGRTALLYRAHPEKPRIELPASGRAQ
jgi:RNA-binding protein